ncbi:MAG: hypothetical protein QHH06_04355 [Clostridiales bacterium]|jgi:tetratricopeptide (TPR) repeat protein|nr:hypothetical protein [Eubacteriales bacterium]MDH7565699.1 hypothetical protein [Clostridiales bacterium]
MKKLINWIKRNRIKSLLLFLLLFLTLSIGAFIRYLDNQSILNASYTTAYNTGRSTVLNIYDMAKGLLAYKRIADSFDRYPEGSTEKLKAMVSWVHNNIRPQYAAPDRVVDDNFYNVLRRGYGYCDNDAQALDIIAFMNHYEVHSLALYDIDSKKSPHTLNEIKWNGMWVVVDPWKNVVFEKDGKLLAKEDIIMDGSILKQYGYAEDITPDCFKNSFVLKPFPLVSFSDIINKLKENRNKVAAVNKNAEEREAEEERKTAEEARAAGKTGNTEEPKAVKPDDEKLKEAIYTYDQARKADIAGDYQEAFQLYNKIETEDAPADIREAADFQKAVVLLKAGDYDKANELFNSFLTGHKDSEWIPSVYYFLGQISALQK